MSFKFKKLYSFSFVIFLLMTFQISGQTWSGLMRLTWNAGDSKYPVIAADSGSGVHVVWRDNNPGNNEIFYKRSTDGGTSWSGLTRLTWNGGESKRPSIAAAIGGVLHVVWYDDTPGNYEIFYKHSTDGGTSWSGLQRMTWNSGFSQLPVVDTDSSNNIHIVWDDDTPGNYEIFYKRSTDGGASWSGLIRMTWNTGNSYLPSITADTGSNIHVVWFDDSPGNFEIFYKRSTDGGTSWSGLQRMTWNGGGSARPDIAADSGNGVHVAWYDDTPGNNEIFYKHSTDGGASWSGLKRLTWNTGHSFPPSITADTGGNIHVVWYDKTPGNFEIFYKHSTDGGASWSGLKRLTWNTGNSYTPSITADTGSNIHVMWYDDTPGNYEIFYKNRK